MANKNLNFVVLCDDTTGSNKWFMKYVHQNETWPLGTIRIKMYLNSQSWSSSASCLATKNLFRSLQQGHPISSIRTRRQSQSALSHPRFDSLHKPRSSSCIPFFGYLDLWFSNLGNRKVTLRQPKRNSWCQALYDISLAASKPSVFGIEIHLWV